MSDWSKDINKQSILFYMNKHGGYGSVMTIDNFEVQNGLFNYNGVVIPSIHPKNGATFIPWGLTKTFYKDVILFMISDMREAKLTEIGI